MPTRLGVTVGAAGCLLVVAGALLGYRALMTVGCAGVLLQVVALVSVARRPRVTLSRDLSASRVTRGEPAVCALIVTRTSRRPVRALTAADAFDGREFEVAIPRSATTVTYRLDTARRGVFTLGPLRLRRADGFGLAAVSSTAGGDEGGAALHVRPRTHPFAIVPSGRSTHLDGPVADTALARSITFHRLREYTPGDDLRHVHWRSTARTGRLMVREYIDTSLPGTTVLLDADGYATPELFEEAVEVAASALVAAVRSGFPARLAAGGVLTEGRADAAAFLDRLAALPSPSDGEGSPPGHGASGSDGPGLDGPGLDGPGSDGPGSGVPGSDGPGSDWSGSDWSGPGASGLGASGLGGGALDAAADVLPATRSGGVLLAVTGAVRAADAALLRRLGPGFDHVLLAVLTDAPGDVPPGGRPVVCVAPDAVAACAACGDALRSMGRP
jgi:uncharacterized protein (DUF58 family)